MRWTEISKEQYQPIKCVDNNGNLHYLYCSVRNNTQPRDEDRPNAEELEALLLKVENPTIDKVKPLVLALQQEYDKCNEVNRFKYKGYTYWFDKDTRSALRTKFEALLNKEQTYGTIWFGNSKYEVDVMLMLDFLEDLEIYAATCNDVTRTHLNQIRQIDNLEELVTFKLHEDYPEPITIPDNTFKD